MLTGLLFAPIGYVFTKVLMQDVFTPYRRLLYRLPGWLGKPLGLCSVCFTGQLSLWGMLPFVELRYDSIIWYAGIISINIIIVKLLSYGIKED